MIHQKSCFKPHSNPGRDAIDVDTVPSLLQCLSIADNCRRLIVLWRRVRVAAPSVTVCVKRQASSVEFKRRVSIVSVSVKRRVSVVSVKRQCPCQRRVIFLSPSSEPPLLWPSSLSSSSHPLLSVDSASLPAASIQRQRQRCQAPAPASASSRVSLLFLSSGPPLR